MACKMSSNAGDKFQRERSINMRRLLFFLIMPLHFLLGMPLLGLVHLVGTRNKKLQYKWTYKYNRLTAWWLYVIAGAKVHASGLENIPTDHNVLYVGNHKSMLDIPLLMKCIKTPLVFVSKKGVLKYPVLGWWIQASGALFLERGDARKDIEAILASIERLKGGETLVIFPEGTRSKEDAFLPFKQGSMKLASKSGVPIIPFAVKGTAEVFEGNHINLSPEHVYIQFGEPIILSELPKEVQMKSAEYVSEQIRKMYDGFDTNR